MSIFGNIFNNRSFVSPNSITFDASRYAYQGERDGTRVWSTAEGDGLGLYFFPSAPGFPPGLKKVGELREFYAGQMAGTTLSVVDCRVKPLDGVLSIWLIAKGPYEQRPSGAVYFGSLTLPFRDFSFVIKMQCFEGKVTGLREAILVDEGLRNKTLTIEYGKPVMQGWSPDDEKFDSKFPEHPLSRLRRELERIAASVRVEASVKKRARFVLPQEDS